MLSASSIDRKHSERMADKASVLPVSAPIVRRVDGVPRGAGHLDAAVCELEDALSRSEVNNNQILDS